MNLLFTDLDNTMVYSHRHQFDGRKIWVEKLNGKDQSYMTEQTYNFFLEQKALEVVPLTTRTPEQYGRLAASLGQLDWRRALVCNGAVLLTDGVPDEEWTAESKLCSAADRPYWAAALQAAEKQFAAADIVIKEPFMFYIKTDEAEAAMAYLCGAADLSHLIILRDSRKVYCIPKSLNKGAALRRYKERFGVASAMAAGDSQFDIAMLEEADLCFCPPALSGKFKAKGEKKVCGGVFSDTVCRELAAVIDGGGLGHNLTGNLDNNLSNKP